MVSGTLLKNLFKELSDFKAQILSIALVVGIGVGVYFGFSTTYQSLLKSRDLFYQEARFPDLFANLKKAPLSTLSSIRELDSIKSVSGRIEQTALVNLPKMPEPAVGKFISIPDGKKRTLSKLTLLKGKRPSALSKREVIVSENFYKAHKLNLGDSFYANLAGKRKKFIISGVGVDPEHIIAIQPGSSMPDDKHFLIIWTNHSVLSNSLDMQSAFNSIAIELVPNAKKNSTKNKVDEILAKYGVIETFDRDKQISAVYVREELKQLNVQASTIPIIFFLVSAFILNIVISRLINSQRSQIATLKAIGFSNLTISQYYLLFSTLIVGLGTLIGIIIGIWIGKNMVELYGYFYHFPKLVYKFSLQKLLYSILFSLITALFGTIKALRNVYQLNPAQAMRPQSPPSYKSSWFERFFLINDLGPKAKMTVRGIISSPMRSIMVGLGMSFSAVLLILGLFWGDSLDALLTGQYTFNQKETGRIQLTHALNSNVVYQINRLASVVEAEGYRNVAVKVFFNGKEETTNLKGHPDNFRLVGVIDETFRSIPLPKSGLHIGQILANKLGLKIGDTISIEVMEGKKPKMDFKIKSILPAFFTGEILTSRKELAKLMKTDDLVDQVLFRSYGDSAELYKKLKQIPGVLSITYKDAAMKMFNETSAKYLLVFAFIFSLFAGAIAFGISYNNLRVSLSERDREVSTLMILGFKRIEVFKQLISEILALTIVFIPIGWLIGTLNAKWLLDKLSMEEFPIPFHVAGTTYLWTTLIIILATTISCIPIYARIWKLNLVDTLKSRE